MLHILLHFVIPLLIARVFFGEKWLRVFLLLSATMLVDLDHLFATPIYDPGRCSINFHPLHNQWVIMAYPLLLFHKRTRVIGLGLLIHMALDWQDCHFPIRF